MRDVATIITDQSRRAEFARSAEHRRKEARFFEEERRRFEDKEADRVDNALLEFVVGMVLASDGDIAAFTLELDAYDEATVKALIENGERMLAERKEIDAMLEKAHVLPDGRRVFKTEDGFRVFDEHGTELASDVIDPDEIADWRPHYEKYDERIQAYERLAEERAEIIEFQNEVDEVRREVGEGNVTKDRLEEMRERLANRVPKAVAVQMEGYEEKPVQALKGDFDAVSGITPASAYNPARALDQFAPG